MTTTDLRPAKVSMTTTTDSPDALTSPVTIDVTVPIPRPSQGTLSTGRRVPIDTRGTGAAGSNSPVAESVPVSLSDAPQGLNVPSQVARDQATSIGVSLLDPALSFAADVLDDIERVRIANENRLRQLTRTAMDADGGERGFGYDETHPDVARLAAIVGTLKAIEHDATLELQRKLRKHPLGAWVKATRGVGEKQGARLLAAVGDPYIRPQLVNEDGSIRSKEGPRTVSALWAYAGLHVLPGSPTGTDAQLPAVAGDQHRDTDQRTRDNQHAAVGVAAKRKKGERANWSTRIKTRAYLIAESSIKQLSPQCRYGHITPNTQLEAVAPVCDCSPYRVAYDKRRAHTAVTHPEWTDGHSHQDGLRYASKEILKDLWRAAREWHLANGGSDD